MSAVIKIRRGTTSQWSSSTKILQVGELGIDTTLNKIKAGNGSSLWSDLPWLHITPTELSTASAAAVDSANSYTDTAVASLGNTSDSTYVPLSDVGNPDGVASLDENGKIPDSEIPANIARDTEIPSSTTSIPEGTNLYFTDERAQDAVGNSLGSGLSYNDTTGAISVNTNLIATKTYADSTASAAASAAAAAIIDSAPAALNTLNELAAALNDDQNYYTTINNALSQKLSISDATSTYLTQSAAAQTYVSGSNADSLYVTKTEPAIDYFIQNSGTGGYLVNGLLNGPITFQLGKLYKVSVQAAGHPFWFQTTYGAYDQANVYDHPGISGQGTDAGHIQVLLPYDAPQLYYACQFHSSMKGIVLIENPSALQVFVNKTGSYTPVLKDMGEIIEMSGGGTFTITDSELFPVGTTFEVLQTGTSQVTIAGDGFTINATPGLKLRAQWSAATVVKRGLNSWVAFGDLAV